MVKQSKNPDSEKVCEVCKEIFDEDAGEKCNLCGDWICYECKNQYNCQRESVTCVECGKIISYQKGGFDFCCRCKQNFCIEHLVYCSNEKHQDYHYEYNGIFCHDDVPAGVKCSICGAWYCDECVDEEIIKCEKCDKYCCLDDMEKSGGLCDEKTIWNYSFCDDTIEDPDYREANKFIDLILRKWICRDHLLKCSLCDTSYLKEMQVVWKGETYRFCRNHYSTSMEDGVKTIEFTCHADKFAELPRDFHIFPDTTHVSITHSATAVIPEWISELKDLKKLTLTEHKNVEIPDSIAQLKHLECLDLSNNDFVSIPESIFYLSQLKELILERNKIKTLPNSITRLQSLSSLDLSKNLIEDLPSFIGQLQNLTRLNLNYNRIQILPESIGDLTKLNYLKIENNDLSILPRRIVELVELEEFYFAHNDINNLPEEFEKLQNLKSISYKSWNRWEGHWEHILKQGVPALLEYCRQLSQWNPEIIINALRKNQFPAESELNNPRLGKHIGFLEQQCKVIHTEAAEKFFDWLIVQFKIEQKGTGDCVLL